MTVRTSKRRIAIAKSKADALELRARGLTIREVAAELGISKSRAHKMLSQAIADLPKHGAEEVVALETAKLDEKDAALAAKIAKGDTRAIKAGIQVAQRRARLLGLDMPTKAIVAVVPPPPPTRDYSRLTVEEVERLYELLTKLNGVEPPAPRLPALGVHYTAVRTPTATHVAPAARTHASEALSVNVDDVLDGEDA